MGWKMKDWALGALRKLVGRAKLDYKPTILDLPSRLPPGEFMAGLHPAVRSNNEPRFIHRSGAMNA